MTANPSSARRSLVDGLGIAAVIATIALAWPGVRVASADEPLMTVDPVLVEVAEERTARLVLPAREARTCENPGVRTPLEDAMIEHNARRMLREIAMQVEPPPPGKPWVARTDQGIVLNSRGYNYRPEMLVPASDAEEDR